MGSSTRKGSLPGDDTRSAPEATRHGRDLVKAAAHKASVRRELEEALQQRGGAVLQA